jgi:formate dehydrogenase subunit gamma
MSLPTPEARQRASALPPSDLPAGLAPLDAATRASVDELIAAHRELPGALLPLLHALQERLGWVPPAALPLVARALQLSRAEVHGVVSYYHHFRSTPPARHQWQICRAEACRSMGAEALLAQARTRLGCSEAAPASTGGGHSVEPAYCLGLCSLSPALLLDGQLHARLTPARLDALIDGVDTQGDAA